MEDILANGEKASGSVELFHLFMLVTAGSVFALCGPIWLPNFVMFTFSLLEKSYQREKALVKNNMSTLISQLVDSLMVISVTLEPYFLQGEMSFEQIMLMGSNYLFKMVAALLDTIPFI